MFAFVVLGLVTRLQSQLAKRSIGLEEYLQNDLFCMVNGKGKGFPYSIPSVGPGADPGVQAVSLMP